ncbi:MAG: hypothetical protein K0Q97_1965 [Bacillota bacterium]|jgi:hypothetical protein|nr:hypothetical protein [Bacillota bacterium]
MLYNSIKYEEVIVLCYCDFKYSNNNIFLVGFDSLTKNKFQKGFLDLKIFSLDGTPGSHTQ